MFDISPIGSLRKLSKLNLSRCFYIKSLEPLTNCFALEEFTMEGYSEDTKLEIKQLDLLPLTRCPNIKFLDFKNNPNILDLTELIENAPHSLEKIIPSRDRVILPQNLQL